MDDRSDFGTTKSGLLVPERRGLSRRRVVGAATWAAPVIVVASAVPAFAGSPQLPVITATWRTDSFRTTTDAFLVAGTPTYAMGAQRGAIAIDISVSNGGVSNLKCVLTTNGNVVASDSAANRLPTTTWAASNGSLTSDGWTVNPALSTTTQQTSYTFSRSGTTTTAVLRIVLDQHGDRYWVNDGVAVYQWFDDPR